MGTVTSMLGRTAKQKKLGPREDDVLSINKKGFHRIHFRDWGDINNSETVFCLHGLTRNSHDFDHIAAALANQKRVICPDTAGRGQSDWLPNYHDYIIPQYNMDVAVVAAAVGCEKFDLIGTSLGGLMGMVLAAMQNSPVKRLIINDIAPEVSHEASVRLGRYLHNDPFFNNIEEAEAFFRETLAPFSPMDDEDWRELAETSVLEVEGGYRVAYDPAISNSYNRYRSFFDLWKYWTRITCPVLILRGTESDFLTEGLLGKMMDTLPHAELIEFEGVGHTPTLRSSEQIDPVLEWLDKTNKNK